MTVTELLSASGLVFFAIMISRYEKIGLEKDIIVGVIRASIQLMLVGYVLKSVFALNQWTFTSLMIGVMILVAGANAAKRGRGIPGVFGLVTVAIASGALITLMILVAVGAIKYIPMQAIPISGMLVGNAMVASGLTLSRLKDDIHVRRLEILTALSLGATSRQAVAGISRNGIKSGMIPTVDSMKTLGIVQLPGMMTGLILAGSDPLKAVQYQLLVTFMMSSATAISCTVAGLLAYRRFFTPYHQLAASSFFLSLARFRE